MLQFFALPKLKTSKIISGVFRIKIGTSHIEYQKILKVMKNLKYIIAGVLLMVATIAVKAQVPTTQALPDTAQMSYNQISQASKLFVYPSNEQNQQQQKEDEFACYMWALEQSGIDPLNLPTVEVEKVETGPDGGAVKGAAGGALKGAAIGAIAGDAGKGAAIGATAGGIRGVGRSAARQKQQVQQAEANAKATEQAIKDSFVKAFSVCLEGKGYKVSQ